MPLTDPTHHHELLYQHMCQLHSNSTSLQATPGTGFNLDLVSQPRPCLTLSLLLSDPHCMLQFHSEVVPLLTAVNGVETWYKQQLATGLEATLT